MLDEQMVVTVAGWIEEAESVLFITGAGLSADSGLPTYRGVGGLYEDAHTEDGLPIEVALSGMMMASRPELTWKHIADIERACRGAKPNAAHQVMAQLEKLLPRVWVLTQNVDGLHHDAGTRNLIEIHGTVRVLRCTKCDERREISNYAGMEIPPRCAACGAIERPDVVLFGEMLPQGAISVMRTELLRGFDIVFSVGTTSTFPYIAQPVLAARRANRRTVEINPGDTEISRSVDVRIRAGAAEALSAIGKRLGLGTVRKA
jgi:NAD-dependent deacetylase